MLILAPPPVPLGGFLPIAPLRHPNKCLRELGVPYDPELPISAAFGWVSLQRGWKPGSKTWKKHWNSCMTAEYDRLIGYREANLATWQELCAKVSIKGSLVSINQCKKALVRVHVNLVDLLDCWNSDHTPTQFKSQKALAIYTEANNKFFGRHIAKQDKVLRVLLRHIL
ncbi:transcription factor Zn, C2H2 [Penicillium digitatum]|uniref:Uncharacterized protein n=3 Tax=Penicillium digitatum TaxID=36651 RepID=K9FE45_PEND2|nr:hypothetical protein PDIP_04900 [Penicillium digitatum Pd1]EKV06412.1 hypothetical protein PDIG_77790 [Penicillium digitatum PHI26]EKV21611.1 hypothetical protein PDIP_04900 [Penicillium digitatum Pd1]KAG0161716.1 hypothetical protein PDIDSM_1147 [Penicillium digitatum]QQK47430.1 transcription factor Zn, C2H2 [Penicillium digitatum]